MNELFSGVRAKWEPLYAQLKEDAEARLGEFSEYPTSSAMQWKHNSTFAEIRAKKDCLVIGFPSDQPHDEWQPSKIQQTSKSRFAHYFDVTDDRDFPVFLERIEAAYALTKTEKARKKQELPEYATVDEYIPLFPEKVQEILRETRRVIREAAPDATEKISWQMPTYYWKENLVHFAALKDHLGFYPTPEGVEAFPDRTAGFTTTKGSLQFGYDKPIPYDLIADITRFRVEMVRRKLEE